MKTQKNIQKKKIKSLPFKLSFFQMEDFVKDDPLKWAITAAQQKQNYLILEDDCDIAPTDLMGDVLFHSSLKKDVAIRKYLDDHGCQHQKIAELTVEEYCKIQNKMFLERPFAEENNLRYGWNLVNFVNGVSRYKDCFKGYIDYTTIPVKNMLDVLEKIAVICQTITVCRPVFSKHIKACLQEIQTLLPSTQDVNAIGFIFDGFHIPFCKL